MQNKNRRLDPIPNTVNTTSNNNGQTNGNGNNEGQANNNDANKANLSNNTQNNNLPQTQDDEVITSKMLQGKLNSIVDMHKSKNY